jgi:hypothetical protein
MLQLFVSWSLDGGQAECEKLNHGHQLQSLVILFSHDQGLTCCCSSCCIVITMYV